MDDGGGGGAAVCEGVDVGHDVVPELALLLRCHGKVDVLHVALHLLDLGIGDGQAQSLGRTTRVEEINKLNMVEKSQSTLQRI